LVTAAAFIGSWSAWTISSGQAERWTEILEASKFPSATKSKASSYPLAMEIPGAVPADSVNPVAPASSPTPVPVSAALTNAPTNIAIAPPVMPSGIGAVLPKLNGPPPSTARFDVTKFGNTGSLDESGAIKTSKPVILGGSRLGSIDLAVGRGASVSIDRNALAALVGDKVPALTATLSRAEGDRVPLEALRSRDVAIRYDPLADALVIDAH
jgi:hypothetical protein